MLSTAILRRSGIFALAAAFLLLGSAATPAEGAKWEVSLSIKVSGGQQNKPQVARDFVAGLERELQQKSRSLAIPDLTSLAAERIQTFEASADQRLALRGSRPPAQAAGIEGSIEIKIVIKGKTKASPKDAAFLRSLEQKLAADLESGKLSQADLPSAAEQAMADYSARQPDGPQWHKQKPALTFTIGLTIKF